MAGVELFPRKVGNEDKFVRELLTVSCVSKVIHRLEGGEREREDVSNLQQGEHHYLLVNYL